MYLLYIFKQNVNIKILLTLVYRILISSADLCIALNCYILYFPLKFLLQKNNSFEIFHLVLESNKDVGVRSFFYIVTKKKLYFNCGFNPLT